MEQCVISVIIPVYKAEKYLSRCIASLLAQSFTAFELLLIDDGSPDNSGKDMHDWAERDCRIRVLHQTNAGVGTARNKGLDEAKGEYIVFVDSDDYVGTDYLKHLYEERPLNLDSIVVQGFTIVSEQADRQYTTSFIPSVYTGRDVRSCFSMMRCGICGDRLPNFSAGFSLSGWGYAFQQRFLSVKIRYSIFNICFIAGRWL